MIRIAYLSDLHIDHAGDGGKSILRLIDKNKDSFDVLVIAGDVSNHAPEAFEFVRQAGMILFHNNSRQRVIFVPGNHEYYTFEMPWVDSVLNKLSEFGNVHCMIDGSVSYTMFDKENTPYLFCGGTLFTDFALYGNSDLAMQTASRCMSDFSRIVTPEDKILTPEYTTKIFDKTTERIRAHVMQRHSGSKVVVVSHHTPSGKSVAEQYKNNMLTPAFSSALLDEDHPSYQSWTMLVDLWIHGHTHYSFDYLIDHGTTKTRVVCNPRGYPMPYKGYENDSFKFKIVTL